MFERYTEKARRVIFFARYEASRFGCPQIEAEHLLLGLLQEDKALADRFLRAGAYITIRSQVEANTPKRESIPTSVDLPLSHESKRVLAFTAEEARRLNHKHIGTDHLLLGLLREETSYAASMLRERGLDLLRVRETVAEDSMRIREAAAKVPQDQNPRLHRAEIAARLGEHAAPNQFTVVVAPEIFGSFPAIGIFEGKMTRPTGGIPAICLELLSSTDFFGEMVQRVEHYLVSGVKCVWLLDCEARVAYSATLEQGIRRAIGKLQAGSLLEIPLQEIFES